MKKFSKVIFFIYFIPFFTLLFFSDFESAEKHFRPGGFDRAFSIYFFGGIFVLPFLIFGIPSVASIKAELLSDRVRQGIRRKVQTISISLALLLIVGLTRRLVPLRDAMSVAINIAVFITMFSLVTWSHFRK